MKLVFTAPGFTLYAPSGLLARFVSGVWIARGRTDFPRERVLPNGAVELIVNLGSPHFVFGPAGTRRYQRAWLAGMQRAHLDIGDEDGSDLVGVRFRPGGARPWLRVPLHELTDRVEDHDAVGLRFVDSLRDRLGETPTDDHARVALVGAALLDAVRAPEHEPRVELALASLAHEGRAWGVGALSRALGTSHKHLVSLFADRVGLSPVKLGRVLRFDRAVNALRLARPVRWASLAHALGYSDQPHLARDFREFAGVTPTEFLRARTHTGLHMKLG